MDDLTREPPPDPEPEPDPETRRPAVLGLLITLLLVLVGLVLTHVLGNVSRLQDCVMSGRTNCVPIYLPRKD